MAKVKVIGSDCYKRGKDHSYTWFFGQSQFSLRTKFTENVWGAIFGETVKLSDVTVEEVTETNRKKLLSGAAFAAAGAIAFGGAGGMVGAALGGNKHRHTLMLTTPRGKSLIEVNHDVYRRIIGDQLG